MDFLSQITEDIKAAMKARETVRLEALRGIKKELLEAKTAKPVGEELAEAEIMKVLKKMVKQRRDSAQIFTEQGRADLAEPEMIQAEVIEKYLPEEMSAEALEEAVRQIITQVGATSIKDLGKVMGVASKQLAGKADGKAISECVKRLLA